MTFSSPIFLLVFLPICLLGYLLIARFGRAPVIGYLSVMSLIFYGAWDWHFLPILLGSMVCNYLFSLAIAGSAKKSRRATGWLALSVFANLGCLAYFKYLFPLLGFAHSIGMTHQTWGSVILPLGISFFTFTQIAYLIDLKQGAAQKESFGSYFLFVTFFPHLIAGPIIHNKEMMPQFRRPGSYRLVSDDVALGITWFTLGLVKKVLIADRIAPLARPLFSEPSAAGFALSWSGALIYSMQLYFDFSGYSDMALGLARMFSIRFPVNFNSPFKAGNILEFWQRWHITLTRYIMEYLYAPLLMRISSRRIDKGKKVSRKAQATVEGFAQMVLLPTMTTMFCAGVWHGAGLQFILYGLMHGTLISANHAWRLFLPEESPVRSMLSRPIAVFLTYIAVVATFVMFHANSVWDAGRVYAGMLGRYGMGGFGGKVTPLILLALFALVWLCPNTQEILGQEEVGELSNWSIVAGHRWTPSLSWLAVITCAFLLCLAYSSLASTFLYFQF